VSLHSACLSYHQLTFSLLQKDLVFCSLLLHFCQIYALMINAKEIYFFITNSKNHSPSEAVSCLYTYQMPCLYTPEIFTTVFTRTQHRSILTVIHTFTSITNSTICTSLHGVTPNKPWIIVNTAVTALNVATLFPVLLLKSSGCFAFSFIVWNNWAIIIEQ